MRRAALGAAAALALAAEPVRAQVSLSNVAEAQAGSAPFAAYFGLPTNAASVYEQLNLDATYGEVRAGLRFEALDNTQQLETYREITQRWAEWSGSGVRVRAGHFYSILGRGLVQRAFELPGVVLDDPVSERRSAFSRELDGLSIDAARGPFSARLLSGTPGTDALFGGEAAVGPWRNTRIGATYLRLSEGGGATQREVGSGFLELDPLAAFGAGFASLPVYVEYAQTGQSFGDGWRLRTGDAPAHALYVSSNLLAGPFAVSAEWKDYRDFRLGVNDPPSLVREHAFALPNRATHVLNATSEHGIQLEASASVPGWGSVTANHSRSAGTPSVGLQRFEESYLEAHLAAERWRWLEATAFLDRGFDRFGGVDRRAIWGASATATVRTRWSATLDLQRLDATRLSFFGPAESFTDWYASAALARSEWGSASAVWQRTTDPLEEDPAKFGGRVDPRSYFGVVIAAPIGDAHRVQLFAGERRGGPACTAGTCYEVQPFKGAELRIVSRL